jgi:hypothetical protein
MHWPTAADQLRQDPLKVAVDKRGVESVRFWLIGRLRAR